MKNPSKAKIPTSLTEYFLWTRNKSKINTGTTEVNTITIIRKKIAKAIPVTILNSSIQTPPIIFIGRVNSILNLGVDYMKMTSCSVCFAVLPVKQTMVFEHKRICRKCRSKQ